MLRKLKNCSLITLCVVAAFRANAQKLNVVSAKATAVSLYLNGASLSQKVNVNLQKGTNEIVVINVANQMDENSINVASSKPVTILSASFTTKFMKDNEGTPYDASLKKVKDSIDWVNKEISVVSNTMQTDSKSISFLDANQSVGGANSGVSSVELSKVFDFYRQKRLQMQNSIYDLQKKQEALNKTLARLQNQLSISNGAGEKISNGKIVLQVMSEQAQSVQLELTYNTTLASWQPFYEIEAKGLGQPLNFVTKAKVRQATGLDWKQVHLSFSTTQPGSNNEIPYFNPWLLRFTQPVVYAGESNAVQKRAYSSVQAAPPMPMLKADQASSSADYTTVTEQTLSINYDVSIPYDIYSNGKQQTVALANQEIPASYTYYAAPKLSNEVYLIAKIADYAKYNLLTGEAAITFEGRYVGKTFLDPSSTKDTLDIALGVDKDIVVKREQVQEKSGNKTFSGYRQSEFAYNISVRNNKKSAISLILKDQFPVSTDKEITVDLGNTDGANVNNETGTLTWNLDVKPQKTKQVRFDYKVKYPKDKTISNL